MRSAWTRKQEISSQTPEGRESFAGHGAQGDRGGVRVVYYFGGDDMPLILFAVYKGRKDDLTEKEKAELKSIIKATRGQYRREH